MRMLNAPAASTPMSCTRREWLQKRSKRPVWDEWKGGRLQESCEQTNQVEVASDGRDGARYGRNGDSRSDS